MLASCSRQDKKWSNENIGILTMTFLGSKANGIKKMGLDRIEEYGIGKGDLGVKASASVFYST